MKDPNEVIELRNLHRIGKQQHGQCHNFTGHVNEGFYETEYEDHHQEVTSVGPDEIIIDEERYEYLRGQQKQACKEIAFVEMELTGHVKYYGFLGMDDLRWSIRSIMVEKKSVNIPFSFKQRVDFFREHFHQFRIQVFIVIPDI